MQTQSCSESRRICAIEALKSTLLRASGVKIRKIDAGEEFGTYAEVEIYAHVEVYGRSRTLACMLLPDDGSEPVRKAVFGFCHRTAEAGRDATPVLIAPKLSDGFQALCREAGAGMLDLQGNARIELGELFIACQQVPQPNEQRKMPRSRVTHPQVHAGAAA